MWAWGRMYLRISENTLKILSPDISSHGSVDRGCGIRGPHGSPPEAVLSSPQVGLRGPTGLDLATAWHDRALPALHFYHF